MTIKETLQVRARINATRPFEPTCSLCNLLFHFLDGGEIEITLPGSTTAKTSWSIFEKDFANMAERMGYVLREG